MEVDYKFAVLEKLTSGAAAAPAAAGGAGGAAVEAAKEDEPEEEEEDMDMGGMFDWAMYFNLNKKLN